ncbi:ATP-grasp domain-containing protein [Pectobacteriaceae bacterium CE70]|nr:ATP-grasp domain-containing protein [Pectobacteriaceae bacterium CE70]WJY12254.1 ATP-grasp domain-containing protein [Pectobacteriaceae bacterium C80]
MKLSSSLFIRSLDVNQASPFLEMAWEKIKALSPNSLLLLKDQPKNITPLIPGALYENIDHESISKKVIERVISWSVPNERTIEDVTLLEDVDAVPGPITAIYKLSDKRATKSLFEKFFLPTPNWVVLDREFTHGNLLKESFGNKLELELASRLNFPIISKPLWDCMGHGIEIIRDENDLFENLSSNAQRNVLIESFIDGYLGCVEIIGTPNNYFFQPPCFTGNSSSGVRSDFDTVRVSNPYFFKEQLNKDIKTRLCNLLTYLDYSGVCCVDFIVKGDDIYFLEINPRISGISCLGSAASGLNSFEALYHISLAQWNIDSFREEFKNNTAIQIGGGLADKLSLLLNDDVGNITVYRDDVINVDGKTSRNIIAGGNNDAIERMFKSLDISIIELLNLQKSTLRSLPVSFEVALKTL